MKKLLAPLTFIATTLLITTAVTGVTNPRFEGPVAKACAASETVYLAVAPLTIAVTDGPTAAEGLRNLHHCKYNY